MATNRSLSKRYGGMPFVYWWDVWDGRVEAIRASGDLVLVQKDTGLEASIPAADLLPLLTEDRRTTRGQNKGGRGNWGLYVRPHRPDRIEIGDSQESRAYLNVEWRRAREA